MTVFVYDKTFEGLLTAVFDAYLNISVVLGDINLDIAVFVCEFNGVVKQVVNNLINHIRIRMHLVRLEIFKSSDFDIFLFYLLLKGEQDMDNLV